MEWITSSGFVYVQAFGSVILLVGFLIASTLLQQRASTENVDRLGEAPDSVKGTWMHTSALAYFKRRRVENIFASRTHAVPVYSLILVVLFFSFLSYFGADFFLRNPEGVVASYILGGARAAAYLTDVAQAPANGTDASIKLAAYQSSTLFIISMAFLGAYIWAIGRLLTRINTDDMNPSTYYFLTCRILTACLVAAVARHVVDAVSGGSAFLETSTGVPVGLAILGFAIGWNPTLWVDELVRRAAKFLQEKTPRQLPPGQDSLPQNVTLSMIQGLVDDKIERLRELDIDNCQELADENAILLWFRTPYSLEMVVDWIAQAQLCIRFSADRVALLRQAGIRDIFCYTKALEADDSRASIQSILVSVPAPLLVAHAQTIPLEPSYQQILELRDALNIKRLEASPQGAGRAAPEGEKTAPTTIVVSRKDGGVTPADDGAEEPTPVQ
jgi:hypothetical protein